MLSKSPTALSKFFGSIYNVGTKWTNTLQDGPPSDQVAAHATFSWSCCHSCQFMLLNSFVTILTFNAHNPEEGS